MWEAHLRARFRSISYFIAVPAVVLAVSAAALTASTGSALAESTHAVRVNAADRGSVAVTSVLSPCSDGASQCVDTGNGSPLNLRPCPETGPPTDCGRSPFIPNPIRAIPDGTGIIIVCQQLHGQGLVGNWGYTTIWDLIFDPVSNSDGYLFDGFVWTGSNGQVAPSC